jgi:hypothetical protein
VNGIIGGKSDGRVPEGHSPANAQGAG